MLRISKKADYAVFLLGAIARRGAYPGGSSADQVVSAQEIANEAGLGKSVVANLLKEFTKDGVLTSVRGLRGGYRLVVSPASLSLGDIVRVVDGPLALADCASPAFVTEETASAEDPGTNCSLMAFCPSKRPMQVVQQRVAKIFDEVHLDELCGLRTADACLETPSSEIRS